MNGLISIIIPVYNSTLYLRRCLNSVLKQTLQSFEVVLVDDGSTDDSGAICDEYAEIYLRIKVYHIHNAGASHARKYGLNHMQGEYVTFVDSDDIVEDDYLERLYKAVNQYGVRIAACDQIKHQEGTDLIVDKSGEVMLLDNKAIQDRFFKYQFWGLGGKIYHKSVFEGVYFPEYTINEDYVVMAQLFNLQKQMAYVPMGLYHYMTHGDSLSHQKLSKRMFAEYYNKLWVRDFYAEKNPRYIENAEAQLTETCIKLIRCVSMEDKEKNYQKEKGDMQAYLRSNLFSIMFNPYLKMGLKFMLLKCMLSSWGDEKCPLMCFGVWFHEIQDDGFNSALHGPQQKNSHLWGTIRFVTHYVSILALHIEILCAVRTK